MNKSYINQADYLISLLLDIYKVNTISELAKLLGVTQQTISSWKSRNSVRAIEKIIIKNNLREKISQQYNPDSVQFINEVKGINALNNFGNQIQDKNNNLKFDEDILEILATVSTIVKDDNKESFKKHLKNWIIENL